METLDYRSLLDDPLLGEELISADINNLKKWLLNERLAPEMLPYQGLLVEDLSDLIVNQEANLRAGGTTSAQNMFAAQLYYYEVQRLKHLIQIYLKTRLDKIENQAAYLFACHQQNQSENNTHSENEDSVIAYLSHEEILYLQAYIKSYMSCLALNGVKGLPTALQSTSGLEADTQGSMSQPPELDKHVYIRICTQDDLAKATTSPDPSGQVPHDTRGLLVTLEEDQDHESFEYGGMYLVRYRLIRHLLLKGLVSLV